MQNMNNMSVNIATSKITTELHQHLHQHLWSNKYLCFSFTRQHNLLWGAQCQECCLMRIFHLSPTRRQVHQVEHRWSTLTHIWPHFTRPGAPVGHLHCSLMMFPYAKMSKFKCGFTSNRRKSNFAFHEIIII